MNHRNIEITRIEDGKLIVAAADETGVILQDCKGQARKFLDDPKRTFSFTTIPDPILGQTRIILASLI